MVNYMNRNTKEISGPVNVVRLEGDVASIKKVMYLFMDFHAHVMDQTGCDNIFAKDVQLYLAESFDDLNNGNRKYDFFLETFPKELQNISKGYPYPAELSRKEKYLDEIRKFFSKVFSYNPNENKVSISNYFKNVRLHYIDVRDYFKREYINKIFQMGHMANNMWRSGFVDLNVLGQIVDLIDEISQDLQKIIAMFDSGVKSYNKKEKFPVIQFKDLSPGENPQPTAKSTEEQAELDEQYIQYLLHKMFSRYSKPDIQKKLVKKTDLIIENLKKLVSMCENTKSSFIKIGDYVNQTPPYLLVKDKKYSGRFYYGINDIEFKNMLTFIYTDVAILGDKYIEFFTIFMDIYFLRRFLDKDYITNAIVYTGAAHSSVYIEILTKEFGFKVTHASYAKITNIEELNAEILKRSFYDLEELFYPPIFNQCSNMEHFPDNFL